MTIFVLVFAACEDANQKTTDYSERFIGTWVGEESDYEANLLLTKDTYKIAVIRPNGGTKYEKTEYVNYLYESKVNFSGGAYSAEFSGDKLQLTINKGFYGNTSISAPPEGPISFSLTKTNNALKVKNMSSNAIYDIKWNGVTIGSANIGSNASARIVTGSGYIYFKNINSGGYKYRTNSLVVVDKGNEFEFTFTDNTVIYDMENSTTGTLIGIN